MIETGNPVNLNAIVFAATASVALAAVGVTGASASAARASHVVNPQTKTVAATVAGASPAAVSPGTQLWMKLYANRGNGGALSAVVSRNGSTVFVTGYTTTAKGAEDDTTVAYNSATGAQRWAKSYGGPGGTDRGLSVAVSPNGKEVFVTGYSFEAVSGVDYATIAYNAATGAQLWVKRYDDGLGAQGDSEAAEVAVSPNGSTVFVTGTSLSTTKGNDYATIAYNATTGAQRWVARYNGVTGGNYVRALAVSPNGKSVFVTGASGGTNDSYDYATVAYNAVTGAQRWAKRYNGAHPGGLSRGANSVAVSPNGSTVFVTGSSIAANDGYEYATVAYNAATGAQRWAKRHNSSGSGDGQAYSVAVSPSGATVFVTGYTDTSSTTAGYDYTTIAYKAATGAQLWLARYNGTANFTDEAFQVAVAPGGGTVYVTGESAGGSFDGWGWATVAYNAATGARRWVKRYDGDGGARAFSLAVSRTTGAVFVTGYTSGAGDYATIAYKG
jgi:outer membrane protein assembly factor BamB